MRLFAPRYYTEFKCIAERCTHNCCIGWEIDIDADTLARYESLEGALGERIRQGICKTEQGACFALDCEERCPNLDERGLCRIISALGEDYLCDICREHPRFYNEVGGALEVGLGAACEAAAELILGSADYAVIEPVEKNGEEKHPITVCDFDARAWRARLYAVLSDGRLPYTVRRARVLDEFSLGVTLDEGARTALLEELEYLDGAHRALLTLPLADTCDEGQAAHAERFFAYLVYRHASAAACEADFRVAVSLAGLLERLFVTLVQNGTPAVQAARIISEELEYSEDNTDAIRMALQGF